jgi:phenylalanyl-tRNA synthetase alpha chain
MEKLHNLKNEALAQIFEVKSLKELEELKIRYLGRKGIINKLLKNLSQYSGSNKKSYGRLLNETKQALEKAILNQEKSLIKSPVKTKWVDITLPGIKIHQGHLHLVTKAVREIMTIFRQIGFERVRYPEVETDFYAFEGLNMPRDHPARDEWETYFIKNNPKLVLSPHTSSGQIREMERIKKPPIRMINIAKCYRRQSDVSHTTMFFQFEGLVVDQNISIAHLKGTFDYFFKAFYGPDREIRLRPFNFRFTEPSFEVDVSCGICHGTGRIKGKNCRLCKQGWLELAGAGMVHPQVLKNGGIDPDKYSGFAFGTGVERTYMMKEGLKIPDNRILYTNDFQILKQF